MATTRFADHLLQGDHASRPAAGDVPAGTLYACTDHNLIYQSDGASWSTWATLGASSIAAEDVTYDNGSSGLSSGDVQAAIDELASSGGGGLGHSFLGKNSIGGSTEAITVNRVYLKQVTPGSNGLITGISFYLNTPGDGATTVFHAVVLSDSGGSPAICVAQGANGTYLTKAALGNRWVNIPCSYYAASGVPIWIGVQCSGAVGNLVYDAGSDKYYTAGGTFAGDAFYSVNTSSADYSIRADFLS